MNTKKLWPDAFSLNPRRVDPWPGASWKVTFELDERQRIQTVQVIGQIEVQGTDYPGPPVRRDVGPFDDVLEVLRTLLPDAIMAATEPELPF